MSTLAIPLAGSGGLGPVVATPASPTTKLEAAFAGVLDKVRDPRDTGTPRATGAPKRGKTDTGNDDAAPEDSAKRDGSTDPQGGQPVDIPALAQAAALAAGLPPVASAAADRTALPDIGLKASASQDVDSAAPAYRARDAEMPSPKPRTTGSAPAGGITAPASGGTATATPPQAIAGASDEESGTTPSRTGAPAIIPGASTERGSAASPSAAAGAAADNPTGLPTAATTATIAATGAPRGTAPPATVVTSARNTGSTGQRTGPSALGSAAPPSRAMSGNPVAVQPVPGGSREEASEKDAGDRAPSARSTLGAVSGRSDGPAAPSAAARANGEDLTVAVAPMAPADAVNGLLATVGTPAQQVVAGLRTLVADGATPASVPAAPATAVATTTSTTTAAGSSSVKTLTVELNPEHLGPVSITLRLQADGMDIRIAVSTPQALHQLEQDKHMLSAAVAALGGSADSLHLGPNPDGAASPPQTQSTFDRPNSFSSDTASAGRQGQGQGRSNGDLQRSEPDDSTTAPAQTSRPLDGSLYL